MQIAKARPFNTESIFYGFKDAVSATKNVGIKDAIILSINSVIYNNCRKTFIKMANSIQDNMCVGFYLSFDDLINASMYLSQLDPELYYKYTSKIENKVHCTKNGNTYVLLKDGNYKFICKDRTKIILSTSADIFGTIIYKIIFWGKHRHKHADFFLKYMKKYEAVNIKTCNFSIDKETNNLVTNRNITNGVKESAIIFPEKQNVFSYINAWIKSEYYFSNRGVNHKIGILLYGKPGTGKTTFAKVLATKFKLDLIILNLNILSELIKRKDFCDRLDDSVVVFEDIDVLVSKRDNSVTSADRENFQALLQLLDGINSCNKTIFLATTNYIDRLDPALIRDGRFDIKIEMKNFDHDEAVKMCNKFEVDSEVILRDEQYPINPAYLQNKIITLQMKEINEKLKQKAQRIRSNK